MADKNDKKQIPLRISATLYNEINKLAADEFRSLNGQIEYILNEAVKKRKGTPTSADKANNCDE